MKYYVFILVLIFGGFAIGLATGFGGKEFPQGRHKRKLKQWRHGLADVTHEAEHASKRISKGDMWQSMGSAPRDGTVIEIQCRPGIAPWHALFKWGNVRNLAFPSGTIIKVPQETFEWIGAPRENSGVQCPEFMMSWRPFLGDPETYVSPTEHIKDLDWGWEHYGYDKGKPVIVD